MVKNIVVFSDGTGQEGGKGPPTNIYKVFKAIENRTPNQISFYDRGLGTETRGLNTIWTIPARLLKKTTGLGFGKNVLDCYQFIFDNFEAGDKIYMFGFSRGAATVRSVSGFIDMFGILPKSRPELIREAYKIYKIKDEDKRLQVANDFYEKHNTMWTKVEFLGVWDTVSALGLSAKLISNAIDLVPGFKNKFHNFSLSPSVTHAYHALSIDDERKIFHPELWDHDTLPHQSMEQVWFCGVHTDIGGGYRDTGLSDIALNWLIQHSVRHGLLIYDTHILKFSGNPDGTMHNSRAKLWEKCAYTRKERFWPKLDKLGVPRDKPSIHPSVHQRTHSSDNNPDGPYDPWILR